MVHSRLGSTIAVLATAAHMPSSSNPIDSVEAFSGANGHDRLFPRMDGSTGRTPASRATGLFQGRASVVQPIIVNEESDEVIFEEVAGEILTPASAVDINRGSIISLPDAEAGRTSHVEETVPSSWTHALHRFFLGDVGPPLVVLSMAGFLYARIRTAVPLSVAESTLFASSILFWWVQEYFFHRALLHSRLDWVGKSIHRTHHEKNYFHISIDPPELLLGWLLAAHLMLKSALPWHLCLTATVGYALAGLAYEWSHYIVHTKVKPRALRSPVLSRLFLQMRDNHIRHHLVDDRNWYAFSVPAMDDLFGTNPDVMEVREGAKEKTCTKMEQEL